MITLSRRWLLWLALLAFVAGGLWWFAARSSGPSYQIESIALARGDLKSSISASGTVTPRGTVSVGSQVSGQVLEVLVDYNDQVKAGQLLAKLDSSTFDQRVRQAEADLDAARAQVQVQISQAGARRADVSRARVSLADASRDLARKRELLAKGFISQSERDAALTVFRTRREDLRAALAAGEVVDAQIDNAKAIVAQRDAALANTQVDLKRTTIVSPIDGIVIKRTVDAGQTVAASLQAPEMFVIARNLTDMRVEASVDESDIGRVHEAMKANFTVDAFPSRDFSGSVEQVRVSAENAQSVITYTVLVAFENTDTKLLPGMTANVQITTAQRNQVLRLPNAALRVRAPAQLLPDKTPPSSAANQPKATEPPAAQRGNRLRRLRAQLIDTVRPDAQQQRVIDDILKRAGADFRGLRQLAEEERKTKAKALLAQLRQSIQAVLSPEQVAAWRSVRGDGTSTTARVHRVTNGKLTPVDIRTGITDGSFTEVVSGLEDGETIAVAVRTSGNDQKGGPLGFMRLFR